MTHPYFAERLIADHDRALRAASAKARILELARCCKPSRLAATLSVLRQRLQPTTDRAAACCA